ncbi:MAG TPA: response regulator transcription factor [Acidimicrobiales bacterium]|nr:response regulator transcription factor [Acidimicrobiales bacterium]
MRPLAVYPDPPAPELARLLDLAGYQWKAATDEHEIRSEEPDEGWGGAIVSVSEDPDRGWAVCRALKRREVPVSPVLVLVRGSQLDELQLRDDLFDDFTIEPFHPRELEARLRHLTARSGGPESSGLIEFGPLVINPETYEAQIEGAPLDLTYMEYELLRFLASHPGKVFTREVLLNRVWGYEYYGGARTVDVHVRRLRAKLGEGHSQLIQTIRSVGYRLGRTRHQS